MKFFTATKRICNDMVQNTFNTDDDEPKCHFHLEPFTTMIYYIKTVLLQSIFNVFVY